MYIMAGCMCDVMYIHQKTPFVRLKRATAVFGFASKVVDTAQFLAEFACKKAD